MVLTIKDGSYSMIRHIYVFSAGSNSLKSKILYDFVIIFRLISNLNVLAGWNELVAASLKCD